MMEIKLKKYDAYKDSDVEWMGNTTRVIKLQSSPWAFHFYRYGPLWRPTLLCG
ncbi:hypothetical protein [Pedobacter sp. N23S346]|uniref:hypothetical protein n=1 Tax=Pedobacter sp. N23S346 TaxID=3402750 RepID=UPI003AD7A040